MSRSSEAERKGSTRGFKGNCSLDLRRLGFKTFENAVVVICKMGGGGWVLSLIPAGWSPCGICYVFPVPSIPDIYRGFSAYKLPAPCRKYMSLHGVRLPKKRSKPVEAFFTGQARSSIVGKYIRNIPAGCSLPGVFGCLALPSFLPPFLPANRWFSQRGEIVPGAEREDICRRKEGRSERRREKKKGDLRTSHAWSEIYASYSIVRPVAGTT